MHTISSCSSYRPLVFQMERFKEYKARDCLAQRELLLIYLPCHLDGAL